MDTWTVEKGGTLMWTCGKKLTVCGAATKTWKKQEVDKPQRENWRLKREKQKINKKGQPTGNHMAPRGTHGADSAGGSGSSRMSQWRTVNTR